MKHGICLIAAAALRMHPDHKSEMVSQLIFGERFYIQEHITGWYHIEMSHDHYQGWIAGNQMTLLDETQFEQLENAEKYFSTSRFSSITDASKGESFLISGGSTLYLQSNNIAIGSKAFTFHEGKSSPKEAKPEQVTEFARVFLHTPYLWGGRSAFGFDCSGFVQLVFQMAGISLPRDASVQANQGEPVHLIHEARAGDLVFFDDAEENISHVGILLPEGRVIHAYGRVRIDHIDHQGIFNPGTGKYSHSLRLIKRVYP